MRPKVGIIGNSHTVYTTYNIQAGGVLNCEAVNQVADCLPLVIPSDPALVSVEELLENFDGFLLTGGRANVHPKEYGEELTEAHGAMDEARDAITLPLIRACVERGQPFFGICRGFQEVNVAMGGSLYPEVRDLPDRMNHRMPPDGTVEEIFAHRHDVTLQEGGTFHRLFGKTTIPTNTLHGQAVKEAGARIIIEGHAPDGTPEALVVKDAPGFTMSVQWHPEYQAGLDPVSRPLFQAFGDAARAWKT